MLALPRHTVSRIKNGVIVCRNEEKKEKQSLTQLEVNLSKRKILTHEILLVIESLIENLYDEVQKYGVNEIDIKTLSTSTTLKKDDIIQILIDEIIKLKKTPTTSTILDCDLDLTLIGEDCTNCLSICSKLQKMLAAIAVLQSDVEFLKTQI
jgi:hypothetical protein